MNVAAAQFFEKQPIARPEISQIARGGQRHRRECTHAVW
jgi:hypothetical protein